MVYVSPLKALGNDVHKNLEVPLAGIDRALAEAGEPGFGIRAMVHTGWRWVAYIPDSIAMARESARSIRGGGRRRSKPALPPRTSVRERVSSTCRMLRGTVAGLPGELSVRVCAID